MGRRNREAVREMREREGLPTYYEAARPDVLARREWERRQQERPRQERLRQARTGDPAARGCIARNAETVRWSSWATARGVRLPMMRGVPIVAFGEPLRGLGRWAAGSEVPEPVPLDREATPSEPPHRTAGGSDGVLLPENDLNHVGPERDVVAHPPE